MIATTKNENPVNAQKKLYQATGSEAHAINLKPQIHTQIVSTDLQAETALASRNPLNIYAIYPNQQFPAPWEQYIHHNAVPAPYITTPTDSLHTSSQSSELQLALPALPPQTAVSTPTLDTRAITQSTYPAYMIIPSKEIASAALIVSPRIVCWNATGCAFQDPCHIRSSVCQMDNLTPSSKTLISCRPQRLSFANTSLPELSKFPLNSEPSKHMPSLTLVPKAPYCPQD
uniref:Uncharacterized protein n=1 Tax=Romanomermis culicivorax TaxID=13658 RepID=A0A915K511_ROMCU